MCNNNNRSEMRQASDDEKKALGVPPAYTNVLVATDPSADLIATATITTPSGKQKTFYRYSASFIAKQAARKFSRVKRLAKRIDRIEARVARDCLAKPEAMCLRLILQTGIRIGNPHQGEKESFGAATLLTRHAAVTGDVVRLQFTGKKQVEQDMSFSDSVLAGYIQHRQASGEQELFPVAANSVLRYAKSIGAAKVHDFRTLRAMVLADALLEELSKEGPPTTKKEAKLIKKAVATEVARALGNSPAQAIKSYIESHVWPGVTPEVEEDPQSGRP
jgi:DNA topoisomerase-1